MSEHEEITEKLLKEHRYIDENLNNTENTMSDINMLAALQRARSDVAHSSLTELEDRLKSLQRHVTDLYEFMLKHFEFEEKMLSKLLDISSAQELIREHKEIAAKFDMIKDAVANSKPVEIDKKGLLETQSEMVNVLNDLCYLIRQHAGKEDKILRELKSRNSPG